jgi:hypothetical protein
VLNGRFALRCAIVNHRTRRDDLDLFVQAVVNTGNALLASQWGADLAPVTAGVRSTLES